MSDIFRDPIRAAGLLFDEILDSTTVFEHGVRFQCFGEGNCICINGRGEIFSGRVGSFFGKIIYLLLEARFGVAQHCRYQGLLSFTEFGLKETKNRLKWFSGERGKPKVVLDEQK